jgi:hypothetical protein
LEICKGLLLQLAISGSSLMVISQEPSLGKTILWTIGYKMRWEGRTGRHRHHRNLVEAKGAEVYGES